jgi:hypothetical protein
VTTLLNNILTLPEMEEDVRESYWDAVEDEYNSENEDRINRQRAIINETLIKVSSEVTR